MNAPAWPYPAPVDDGGARHLVSGLALPDLPLPSTQRLPVNLRRCAGPAIVFVYPWTGRPDLPNPPGWDDIPGAHGSTPQAAGFRDLHARFSARGVAVLGVSGQNHLDQVEFAERLRLPFPLLSDEDRRFADALGLPRFRAGAEVYLSRLTLIVSHGHVTGVVYPVHPPDRHAADMLDRV